MEIKMAKKINKSDSDLLKCHSELVSESLETTTEIEAPYELPDGWKWVRLGDVCKFENGYAFKSDRFSDKGLPVIRITNIKENEIDLSSCIYTSETDIEDRFLVKKGDLLIAMSGATTGKNGVYLYDEKVYLNQRVGNIKVINSAVLDSCYRNYYIQSKEHEILKNAYGGAQPNISSTKICEMNFPLPPTLEEQKRIVARIETLFAKLDQAKEKAQTVLDSFETRKAAILHQAFTGQLTKKWRAENGVLEESWEEKKLGETYQINPKCIADDSVNASFIPMEKIEARNVNKFSYDVALWGKIKKNHTQFQDGDVCFAKISPCFENGKAFIAENLSNGIGAGTTELIVLRSSKIDKHFTFYIVSDRSFVRGACSTYSGTVGQQRISMDYVRNYTIKIPSLPEQIEIVHILDNILEKENKSKEAAQTVLEQIDLLKKSILARAFRGEI